MRCYLKPWRILKWIAAVIFVLSSAAWVLSLWGVIWNSQHGTYVWFAYGDLLFGQIDRRTTSGAGVEGYRPPDWKWPPWPMLSGGGPRKWHVWAPLWPYPLLAAAVLAVAWPIGRRTHSIPDHCTSCGYDVSAITGPCPECGHVQERES